MSLFSESFNVTNETPWDDRSPYIHIDGFPRLALETSDDGRINRAIEHTDGGTILFDSKQYNIKSTINLKRGIRLLGSSPVDNTSGTVIYLMDNSNCSLLKTPRAQNNSVGRDDQTHFMALENLCFNGNAGAQSEEHTAVMFWGAYVGSYMSHVMVYNTKGAGISLQYGLDVYLQDIWCIYQITDGYAFEINKDATSGQDGYINIKNIYIENPMPLSVGTKDNWNSWNDPTQRGKGMLINRVGQIRIDLIHMEAMLYGIDVYSSHIVHIGQISDVHSGNDTIPDSASVRLGDTGTRVLNIGHCNKTSSTATYSFFKKKTGLTSNNHPDCPPLGFAGEMFMISSNTDIYTTAAYREYCNKIGIRKVGTASEVNLRLFHDPDATNLTQYATFYSDGSYVGIGSTTNQPLNAYKKFVNVRTAGNDGDRIEFSDPLILPTRGGPNNIPDNGIYVYNGRPMINFGFVGYSIPFVESGSAPPTTTPLYVGAIYVDSTNKKVYIATGTGNSGEWRILN